MTDERMEILLKESFAGIKPGVELQEKLLQRLYAQERMLSDRKYGHKSGISAKWGIRCDSCRKLLTAVCGLAVLLITGCAAMGIVKHYQVTEAATVYESYAELQQAEKDLGKAFASVEHFSNGFTFQRAAMMNTEALDDAGEKVFGDQCLELIYGDGTHTIIIGLETSELAERIAQKSFGKLMEETMADPQYHVTELEPVGDVRLYYESYTRKYVPEGYQLTAYDQNSIAAGRYEIVYGTERQYMKSTHRVMWEMDGIIYCISSPYMDKYDAEELGQMAAEIISERP